MLYDPKWEVEAPADIKPVTWQEILLKAADIIEEKRWHQGDYGNPVNGYCILGAIRVAVSGDAQVPIIGFTSSSSAYQAVRRLSNFVGRSVGAWNDSAGQTKENVIATMRKAAYAV